MYAKGTIIVKSDLLVKLPPFLRQAIDRHANRLGMSKEAAANAFFEALIVEITDNGLARRLGGNWFKTFDGATQERETTKERKRRYATRKRGIESDQGIEELRSIDITKLKKASIKSGYDNVYSNNGGWRARIQIGDKWKFLPTRKFPEQAAEDRRKWCEENAPEELLPDAIKDHYNFYKEQNPGRTREEYLFEAYKTEADVGRVYPETDRYLNMIKKSSAIDIEKAKAEISEVRTQQAIEDANAEEERIRRER